MFDWDGIWQLKSWYGDPQKHNSDFESNYLIFHWNDITFKENYIGNFGIIHFSESVLVSGCWKCPNFLNTLSLQFWNTLYIHVIDYSDGKRFENNWTCSSVLNISYICLFWQFLFLICLKLGPLKIIKWIICCIIILFIPRLTVHEWQFGQIMFMTYLEFMNYQVNELQSSWTTCKFMLVKETSLIILGRTSTMKHGWPW